ncbi:DNA partition complex ParG [Salmonella enterica subsp. enterica]
MAKKESEKVANEVSKPPVRIQVYTTEEKHRAFKMICASNGKKMTDVVDDLITAYLKENGITIEK